MSYAEYAAPPALRSHVACLWAADGPGAGTVLPDGCVDVVWTGSELIVAGADTRVARGGVAVPGPVRLGVRFRVGAAGAALGLPAHELTDQRVRIGELWRDGDEVADRLAAALAAGAGPRVALAELAAATGGRVRDAAPVDPLVRAAAVELTGPDARVGDVAARAGVSQRHLLRRFRAGVGYGPKTLARVLRLQRFLAAVRAGGRDLAWLAADAGYVDQSHLARDCAALAGATPGALMDAGRVPAGDASLVSSA